MERLTNNEYILKTINNAEKDINKLKDIILRLAEYEDTGLTPKEIKELKADRDYWKAEAKKWCNKLGEIRMLIGEQN